MLIFLMWLGNLKMWPSLKLFFLRCAFLLSVNWLIMKDDEEIFGLLEGNSGVGVYNFLINKQTEHCVMTWTSILRELDGDRGSWENWIQLHLSIEFNFSHGEVLIGWFRHPMAFYLWGLYNIILFCNFHSASHLVQISAVLGEQLVGKICLQINQSCSHTRNCCFICVKLDL